MIMYDEDCCERAEFVEPMITITRREYDELCEQRDWLISLDAAGVDNWDGIEYAHKLHDLP